MFFENNLKICKIRYDNSYQSLEKHNLELCFLIFSPQVVQTRYQKSDLLKQFQKTIYFNTDSS